MLGKSGQLVLEDVQPGIELLDVEQLQLGEGIGFQRTLLAIGSRAGRRGRSTGR
jgi:hypothetical protein